MILRKVKEGGYWLYQVGSIQPKIGGEDFVVFDEVNNQVKAAHWLHLLNGGNLTFPAFLASWSALP